jgi:hypothetical protein
VARVFISYAREDQPVVRSLAEALEQARHDVWWDVELRGGAGFREVIERQLAEADVVLVVWSQRARLSRFVVDEAEIGVRGGKLLPVRIDTAPLPLGFGGFNVLDLADWGGDVASESWRRVRDEIDRIAAGSSPAAPRPPISIWRPALAVAGAGTAVFGTGIWALYALATAAPTRGLLGHPIVDCLTVALLGSAPVALWSGVEVKRAGFESPRLVLRRALVWLRRGAMVALVLVAMAIVMGAVRAETPRGTAIELGRLLMLTALFAAAILSALNALWFLARRLSGARAP